ncbi:phage protein NinX family protein [Variovorax boronicumulans]|uniref:phage protein NinX family protein n=1 Tax=Variovorax boronicumulans TaxID=436515 RepID=UPI0012E48037|nr:phage protein NinX family protein [Variovorax boronicumulans]GER16702.1 DUF2591 domain-containing protein [Variovorax boronicumulans]
MKTADLKGPWLDYWVAKAEGLTPEFKAHQAQQWVTVREQSGVPYAPSTAPGQGQPIMERHRIGTSWDDVSGQWHAELEHAARVDGVQRSFAAGPTQLLAAMRVRVMQVYGEEVPDA